MKTRLFQKMLAVAVLSLFALNLPAQDTTNPPLNFSYGVSDILKLSQAKLSDDTIIQFINAVGDDYALTADQIIYLRQQGLSENVIKVMLHSRGGTAATLTPPTLNFTAPAPVAASPADTSAVTSPADLASNQPPVVLLSESAPAADVQPVVMQPPGSVTILPSVENIDASQPAVVYYQTAPSYYPAYGYGWSAPIVTVSSGNFYGHRFGGFHGTVGFHGGGGFSGGGGFHGGAGFHGGGHFEGGAHHH